jgi:hypothetical protein
MLKSRRSVDTWVAALEIHGSHRGVCLAIELLEQTAIFPRSAGGKGHRGQKTRRFPIKI